MVLGRHLAHCGGSLYEEEDVLDGYRETPVFRSVAKAAPRRKGNVNDI